jgi:hypothetical protein
MSAFFSSADIPISIFLLGNFTSADSLILLSHAICSAVSLIAWTFASSLYLSRHMPAFFISAAAICRILSRHFAASLHRQQYSNQHAIFLYLARHILCSTYILFLYAGSHLFISAKSLVSRGF